MYFRTKPRRAPPEPPPEPADDNTDHEIYAFHLANLNAAAGRRDLYPEHLYRGRGIVIGAGGAKFFGCAWAAAYVLRRLGCQLPIEFWYLGRYELDPTMAAAASSAGIVCRDASNIEPRPRILNGWELKPFSIIHSSFTEVLYLDADNIPVIDPSYLFDCEPYRRHGAMFWPDLPPPDRTEWLPAVVWRNCGIPPRNEVDFESGQILIDKSKCWHELQVTMHINEWSDWYYQFVFGDKSTYHLAWRKCRRDYAIPSRAAGWNWPAIQQHDPDGRLVFQHACRGKESICSGDSLPSIVNCELVYEAARELRQQWAGHIWNWNEQTEAETAVARELLGRYNYDRVGIGARPLELLAGGEIGLGADRCEKRWTLRILDGRPTIAIVGEAHKGSEIAMMLLTERDDGIWRGRWSEFEKCPVELSRAQQ